MMKQLQLIESPARKLTPSELERRIRVFALMKFANPATCKPFTPVEICRVLMKHFTANFNPAIQQDKDDLLYLLREQYYTDVELDAQARRINHMKLIEVE